MYAYVKPALDSAGKKLTRFVMLTPAALLAPERKVQWERWLRGREQIHKLRQADLVVVSFGKSGRTWLRVMLSRYFQVRFGLPETALIGFDNLHLRNNAVPKIFFTHDNYVKDFSGNHDSKADYYGKKVVLLVRHPADVAVSQYHQWRYRMRPRKKTINAYPEEGSEISIFDFVAQHEAGLAKVVDFMNLWAAERDRVGEVFILRYEDLRSDPQATLARLLSFLGMPGRPDEIAEAVRFSSFENMRKLEEKRTFWLSGGRMAPRDKANPESFKVRRGKVGGWRDYFDEAQAAEIDEIVQRKLTPLYGYDERAIAA